MMFGSFSTNINSLIAKSRALIENEFRTEPQRIVSEMLYDDAVEVLTTFDMNRIASLTFGEEVCGEIFDLIEHTLRRPVEFTALSHQKTMILIRHLAIYGAQKACNTAWMLRQYIKPFIEYNTVLLAHSDPNSLMATIQRIKGGSVDHGLPVRNAAQKVYDLLNNVEELRKERGQSSDPNSLVPIGSREETAFVSDKVRQAILEEKIRKERAVRTKSNLGQSHAGFGAGYGNAVGAAHGIEEMLKMANKSKGRFTDDGFSQEEQDHFNHLDMLEQELQQKKIEETKNKPKVETDLLDMGSNAKPKNSMLGFGSTPQEESFDRSQMPFPDANEEPTMATILERRNKESDNFYSTTSYTTTSPTVMDSFSHNPSSTSSGSEDLLGFSTSAVSTSTVNNSNNNVADLLDMMGSTSISSTHASAFVPITQQPIQPSSTDNFNPVQPGIYSSGSSFPTTSNPPTSASAISSIGLYSENSQSQTNNFQSQGNNVPFPSAMSAPPPSEMPPLPPNSPPSDPPAPTTSNQPNVMVNPTTTSSAISSIDLYNGNQTSDPSNNNNNNVSSPPTSMPPPSGMPPSAPTDLPPTPPESPPPMGGSAPNTSNSAFPSLESVTEQSNLSNNMSSSMQGHGMSGMPGMMPNQNNNNNMSAQQQQLMMQNMMMMMNNKINNNMSAQQQQLMMQNMMMMMNNQMMNGGGGGMNMNNNNMNGGMTMADPQQQAQMFQQMQMNQQQPQQPSHQSSQNTSTQNNVDPSKKDDGYPSSLNPFG